MRRHLFYILLFLPLLCQAGVYRGRVLDEQGHGIGYATIYPKADPIAGTATNMEGYFEIRTDMPDYEDVIISYIGYEKVMMPLAVFEIYADTVQPHIVTLREQPIALEETVIAAKAGKQRNKRKQIASLLSQVYNRMAQDFSMSPAQYRIVSDVRMDSEGEAWGMEQMIATIVNLPGEGHDERDSVQFHGDYCKRYFRPDLRLRADTILAGNALENFDKSKNAMDYRRAANSVDSGVVVHRSLWAAGNIRYDMEKTIGELKRWSVSNESEGETVLTYTEKHNYLGIFKMENIRHYILDSETLSVRRFSEHAEFWVNIPFGFRLNADQLQLLNMLNMGEKEIEKFRLRKAHACITLNTMYQWVDGKAYTLEKNLQTDAEILGTKKYEIPIRVKATQRVVELQTQGVKPMRQNEMTRRLKREIVEIY